MKKKSAFIVLIALCILAGCNRQMIDTTWKYEQVIIRLPDGTLISGQVQSWNDYKDGDQIQVSVDGKTYLIHSSQVALISGE